MESIFSAREPFLGYLYQIRYGLLLILKEENQNAKLFIENIDDISIEKQDSLEVYQTKFHIKSVANLTDKSTDLWKTIRVWCEGILNNQITPETCIFHLITTAKISEDTIPSKLRHDTHKDRNIDDILKSLIEVAENSKNADNKASYEVFKKLNTEQQKKLISKISIVDGSNDINKTKEKIKICLQLSTYHVESLFIRLEGWFLNEIILQLQNHRAEITLKEIKSKIHDFVKSLNDDNLPIDFPYPIKDESQLSLYKDRIFVQQLENIGFLNKIINIAISDYHRAYYQRSKWMREGLISSSDEYQYELKLIEDWERNFATLEDILENGDELSKKIKGKQFYEEFYVKKYPTINIKDKFKEQYMVTGSCHILSDVHKIGWHPEFKPLDNNAP